MPPSFLLSTKYFILFICGNIGALFFSLRRKKQNKTGIPFRDYRWEIQGGFLKLPQEHWRHWSGQSLGEAETREGLETGGRKFVDMWIWTQTKYKDTWSFTLRLPTFELWSYFVDHFTYIKDKVLSINIHCPIFNRRNFPGAVLGSEDTGMNPRPAVHWSIPVSWRKQHIVEQWQWDGVSTRVESQRTVRTTTTKQSSLVWGTLGRSGVSERYGKWQYMIYFRNRN